jgi:hypothetical protein
MLMHREVRIRIDGVVNECLDRCHEGPKSPFATLADVLDDLERNWAWSRHELGVIRASAADRLRLETSR